MDGQYFCSTIIKRIVEIFKIDVTKKPLYSLLELHHYTDDCSDNINSTYKINSNLQLCHLKYDNNILIRDNVRSIKIKAGYKVKLYRDCEGNDQNKFMTIDNLNSENDTCVELNQNALSNGYEAASFEHSEWIRIHQSSSSSRQAIIKEICDSYNHLYTTNPSEYPGCNYYCCQIRYLDFGYIRFMNEPNPILDRLLIGNPSENDDDK